MLFRFWSVVSLSNYDNLEAARVWEGDGGTQNGGGQGEESQREEEGDDGDQDDDQWPGLPDGEGNERCVLGVQEPRD